MIWIARCPVYTEILKNQRTDREVHLFPQNRLGSAHDHNYSFEKEIRLSLWICASLKTLRVCKFTAKPSCLLSARKSWTSSKIFELLNLYSFMKRVNSHNNGHPDSTGRENWAEDAVAPQSRVAFCGDYVETGARMGSVEAALLSGDLVAHEIHEASS